MITCLHVISMSPVKEVDIIHIDIVVCCMNLPAPLIFSGKDFLLVDVAWGGVGVNGDRTGLRSSGMALSSLGVCLSTMLRLSTELTEGLRLLSVA